MIRKHTRRAATAALATSLGVAIVIGGTATAADSAARPTVVIGTKDSRSVLGQLYKQALQAKGFKVRVRPNMGRSEVIHAALQSGKINFYLESTGVIVSTIAHQRAPKSARGTYLAAKRFEERHGLTLLDTTRFTQSHTFTVLRKTAKKLDLTSIGDVKKVKRASFAADAQCRTQGGCYAGMRRTYGLTNVRFVAAGSIPVTRLIDSGRVTGGDVLSTDPALQNRTKYVVLDDTKAVFGFQHLAPVVPKRLVTQLGSDFTKVVNDVSNELTQDAILELNKAVAVGKRAPSAVARAFLKANRLL